MADEEVIDQVQEVPAELIAEARDMGWRPKDEFKGDEAKWVDAKTFVERGEHVLPIVKATNARLRQDLASTNARLEEVSAALEASKESTDALERYHQEDVKQKVEKARAELKTQLVAAKKAGDVESEVNLTDELTRLNTAEISTEEELPKKTVTPDAPRDYTKDPIFIAWKEDNPWFGTDRAKTAIATDVSAQLRASGDVSVGREFMDKVAVATAKEVARLGGGRATTKVESSKGGSTTDGGNGKGKSYADLPADAKAACDSYTRDLVGPNRRYKTTDEWRKSYAEQHFKEI